MQNEQQSVATQQENYQVPATDQSIDESIGDITLDKPDDLDIAQAATPPWEKARSETRINAPFVNATSTSSAGFLNSINLMLYGALTTGGAADIFQPMMPSGKPISKTEANAEFSSFVEKPYNEQVEIVADKIKRIDDPGYQKMMAAAGATIDAMTFTRNPVLAEAQYSNVAGRNIYDTMSMGLPMARDLTLAMISGGAYGVTGLAAAFGCASGLSAYNQAEAMRETVGEGAINPMVAFAVEGGLNYIFPKYISAPAQLAMQQMMYNSFSKVLPNAVAPRAAQLLGAAGENLIEATVQDRAIGNAYAFASSSSQERMSNWQLSGVAVLGALMDAPTHPHAIGFEPAMDRIARRVNDKVGGMDVPESVLAGEPALGMSVSDVSRIPLDRSLNGYDLAMKTMRDVIADAPVTPDGIRNINLASIESEKNYSPAAISTFKRSFISKGPSPIKEATPIVINKVSADALDASGRMGEKTRSAYNRIIERQTTDKAFTEPKKGETDEDDFAQVMSHLSLKTMLDGGKPSDAFLSVGIDDPVVLHHIDNSFEGASLRRMVQSDWQEKYPEFSAKVQEIDQILEDVGHAPLIKDGKAKREITENFIKTAKDAVLKEYPPLSKDGMKAAKNIEDKLRSLKSEYAERSLELRPEEVAINKKKVKLYEMTENEEFLSLAQEDMDSAIDSALLNDSVKRIMQRAENAKVAASMGATINEYFKPIGYRVEMPNEYFGLYDGLLSDKALNEYAKKNWSVQRQIADASLEMADPKNFNQLGEGVAALYRTAAGGNLSFMDKVATISSSDPIAFLHMKNAYVAERTAGIMSDHIDFTLHKALSEDMPKTMRALTGSDNAKEVLRKSRAILDVINNQQLLAKQMGQEIEVVPVQGKNRIFFAPKVAVADGRFTVGEIQFAMKLANFESKMYRALQRMDQSMTAINPHDMIYDATNWPGTPDTWKGESYFPRTLSETGKKSLEEAQMYADILPSERIHMNRNIGRKPNSRLSADGDMSNPNRLDAIDELFEYYDKEWRYGMTQAQVDKHLDYYINHRFGYKEGITGDGKRTATFRRFRSRDNGIESIAEKYRKDDGSLAYADIEPLIDYHTSNKMTGVLSRRVDAMDKSPEGRAFRAAMDIVGVGGNLLAKSLIGAPRGLFYTMAGNLQGIQQSFSYNNVNLIKHPFRTIKSLASTALINPKFIASKLGYGIVKTMAKSPRSMKILNALNVDPNKFDAKKFQEGVAEASYRKGDIRYNNAIREYFTKEVPMFHKDRRWDVDAQGSMVDRSSREWREARKTGRAADYIRAVTTDMDNMTNFLVWGVNAADASSKAWTFSTAWDHFDEIVNKRYSWDPKNPEHATMKVNSINRELHQTLFSKVEWSDMMNQMAIGNIDSAQKMYATMFAERTTPSFTTANKSTIGKTLSKAGQAGRLTGRFAEWTFKAMPNMVQVFNEAKVGNYAPLFVTALTTMAYYQMYDKWLEWYGDEKPDYRNVLGRDIMNVAFSRNFQDVTGIATHFAHYIANKFDDEANSVQKMSKPSLPFTDDTFLTSYFGLLSDLAVSASDPDEFNKILKRRSPGYRSLLLMLNGEFTETNIDEARDFLDFWIEQAENSIGAATSAINTKIDSPEKTSVQEEPTTPSRNQADKQESKKRMRETLRLIKKINKEAQRLRRKERDAGVDITTDMVE